MTSETIISRLSQATIDAYFLRLKTAITHSENRRARAELMGLGLANIELRPEGFCMVLTQLGKKIRDEISASTD